MIATPSILPSIPLSVAELAAAVRAGETYHAARLDRVLCVDTAAGVIEVQAATRWTEIAARLRPGHARTAMLGSAMATVGESLAANAAGPDGRPAVHHVQGLTLVLPSGQLVRASRRRNAELFALAAGGNGVIGALYSITLDIASICAALDEAVGAEVLAAPRAACARRALRVFVPPLEVQKFLEDAQALCHEWRMELAGVRLRRTRIEEDTLLRWARREYAALSLTLAAPADALGAEVRATQLRRALIGAAIARAGSFPVHCTLDATPVQAEACYPELPRFLAEKRRIDPQERFVNSWYRHYRRLFSAERVAVRFGN